MPCSALTLQQVFPNWLIVLGLVLTLAYMTVRTAKKGMEVHRQEERAALVRAHPPRPRHHTRVVNCALTRAAGAKRKPAHPL